MDVLGEEISVPVSTRAQALPPYIFARMEEDIDAIRRENRLVVDLGISDPDLPPPNGVAAALVQAVGQPGSYRYPPYGGIDELRQQVADWYRQRFAVNLDPTTEVLITGGSKEALIHVALATTDPKDAVLVPDPGYPAYHIPSALFDLEEISLPLRAENHFLPDWTEITPEQWKRIRLGYLNYPNNPTGVLAPDSLWQETIDLAARHGWTVVSDLAYVDIVYQGRARSIMEFPGAKDVALETLTFSKSYSMQGFRLGAVVGNAKILKAMYRVESQINAGVYVPIQTAGTQALKSGMEPEVLSQYRKRRDYVATQLAALGFHVPPAPATLYFWLPMAPGVSGTQFCRALLRKAGVALTPGAAFGPSSDRFVRLSFTEPLSSLSRAFDAWHRALPIT